MSDLSDDDKCSLILKELDLRDILGRTLEQTHLECIERLPPFPEDIRIAWTVTGVVIAVAGIVGNMCTLLVICSGRNYVKNFSAYVLTQSASNILVMLLFLFDVVELNDEYIFGDVHLCLMKIWTERWIPTFNTWFLVAQSMLRLVSILRPMHFRSRDKITQAVLILCGIVLLSSVPHKLFWHNQKQFFVIETQQIICNHETNLKHAVSSLTSQCLLPGFLIACCNAFVARALITSVSGVKLLRPAEVTFVDSTQNSIVKGTESPILRTETYQMSSDNKFTLVVTETNEVESNNLRGQDADQTSEKPVTGSKLNDGNRWKNSSRKSTSSFERLHLSWRPKNDSGEEFTAVLPAVLDKRRRSSILTVTIHDEPIGSSNPDRDNTSRRFSAVVSIPTSFGEVVLGPELDSIQLDEESVQNFHLNLVYTCEEQDPNNFGTSEEQDFQRTNVFMGMIKSGMETILKKRVVNPALLSLFVLTASFFVFNLPIFVLHLYHEHGQKPFLDFTCTILFYLGHCSIVFLYVFSGKRFRQALRKMLVQTAVYYFPGMLTNRQCLQVIDLVYDTPSRRTTGESSVDGLMHPRE